jgi:hypothetical protein
MRNTQDVHSKGLCIRDATPLHKPLSGYCHWVLFDHHFCRQTIPAGDLGETHYFF